MAAPGMHINEVLLSRVVLVRCDQVKGVRGCGWVTDFGASAEGAGWLSWRSPR